MIIIFVVWGALCTFSTLMLAVASTLPFWLCVLAGAGAGTVGVGIIAMFALADELRRRRERAGHHLAPPRTSSDGFKLTSKQTLPDPAPLRMSPR